MHFNRIVSISFALRYRVAMISHVLRRVFGLSQRREIPDSFPDSFPSSLSRPVWATTILHNPMTFATMSAFPHVFAMDGTGSHVSLSGMTLLRNLRNHEQVLKALRDELATPSVTKATLSSPVFWRTSPTSVCCPWNN